MTERPADGRSHMSHPPIFNGMDYLDSVVDHLPGEPKPRDLKYAVLHLLAATEALLKARLLQEHWSLVFRDPGRPDRREVSITAPSPLTRRLTCRRSGITRPCELAPGQGWIEEMIENVAYRRATISPLLISTAIRAGSPERSCSPSRSNCA